MGSYLSSYDSETSTMAQSFVDKQIKEHKVVVFSKTYCGYCATAKAALKDIDEEFTCIELDNRKDGDAIQDYLLKLTGGRSVPRVFVKGNFIGGGTETRTMKNNGKLKKLIEGDY